jgi:16S rRNA (adenine1518-N6/adenine1519-N6)-dimethyltransferase
MVQTYATVERCFDLPPQCFRPKPQVRSSVVKIIPREPIYPVCDRSIYADVVRTLFSHRRKTVRNCLKSGLRDLKADQIRQLILRLPDRILQARPEELSLEDFASLAEEVYGISNLSNRG